jgi:hypothetical protein
VDADEQDKIDDAMRAVTVGYAVLDEAELNPEFANLLIAILDDHVRDRYERDLLALAPLKEATVLDFKAPHDEGR